MKKIYSLLLAVFTLSACATLKNDSNKPQPEAIKALTTKVAHWQIRTFDDHLKYRAIASRGYRSTRKYHDLVWHMGALYAGMNEWRKVTKDQELHDFLYKIGNRNKWSLHKRPYHADDHTVGQFYLDLYQELKEPKILAPTQERFDWILKNRKTGSLEWKRGTDSHNRWGWCDALFMAPPVWARLAKVTGDQKYLKFMDEEFHATYDLLWDKDEQLFWRDSSFFPKREKNGKKVFWARGNGWVFGGLALMIPDLPKDWEGREFYIQLFKEMAETLKKIQREDGTWSMGLLGGTEGYPIKETSGTSFYTFGLAWAINNGILDRETYEPVVVKAWKALEGCVTPEGILGYVQPVGAAPGDSFEGKTEVYGIGAFLAAGSEVYKMFGGKVETKKFKKVDLSNASPFTTYLKNSGWCWYEDPRAIVHQDKIFVGGVEGNGNGAAVVGVYDLKKKEILGRTVVNKKFDRDDHNSPVFFPRSDGSVLTVYARHGRDRKHRYRISNPNNPLDWGKKEMVFKHSYPKAGNATYMNLYNLSDEKLLYNFFRGIEWNPCFMTSNDEGKTWNTPVHFIKSEVKGVNRPYPRYTSNGKDTVYVSFTDTHPRNFGTGIYYAEFRNGAFYRADGTKIKELKDGPLRPSESEVVREASKTPFRNNHLSAERSAWTSSIAIDKKGNPHIGYTYYISNTDHRYYIASWNGKKWIDREVAFGGNCLYDKESSYTGLITLDPKDPSVVFISTDVNPTTGKDNAGKHEIYRAKISLKDTVKTVKWKAVTKNSKQDNLRPVVLREKSKRYVLWSYGEYKTYTNYNLDTVGFEESVK